MTDAEGSFRLLARPGSRALVWVEAEGYAPVWLPDLAPDGDGSLGEVVLVAGSGLDVQLSLPPEFPLRRYHLELHPISLEWPLGPLARRLSSAREGHATMIWRRALPADGLGHVVWRSLPPGSYEVWLRGSLEGAHSDVPYILGEVALQLGETRFLSADLAEASPDVAVPTVEKSGEARALLQGGPLDLTQLQVASWQGAAASEATYEVERVSGGTLLTVPDGCLPDGVHIAAGSGWIAEPLSTGAGCDRLPELSTYPAAAVSGLLESPRGFAVPEAGSLWGSVCGRRDPNSGEQVAEGTPPVGPFPFKIEQDGTWFAMVPAACATLTLRTADFGPLQFDGLSLQAAEENRLGVRRLVRGSSLLVRAIDGRDGLPVGGARVDLLTADEIEAALSGGQVDRSSVSQYGGTTGLRGWARLAGLPEGVFVARVVSADHPLPAYSRPFTLSIGRETVLDDLELVEPSSLTVAPGDDSAGLIFRGARLRLDAFTELASCGERHMQVMELDSASGSEFELPTIYPGDWTLTLAVEVAPGRFNTLGSSTVHVAPGFHERVEVPLTGEYFRGFVTMGGEPVVADLTFRAQEPTGVAFVPRATSDRDGRFEVVLGAAGRYDVAVVSSELHLYSDVPDVLFDDRDSETEIALPDGVVRGWVVRGNERIGGATVTAARIRGDEDPEGAERATRLQTAGETDADGTFELPGLTAGSWTVKAADREESSVPIVVELREGEVRSALELQLEESAVLHGRILGRGEPIAGARGALLLTGYPDAMDRSDPVFHSGPDGRFEVELPPSYEGAVVALVEAVGWPVAAFRVTKLDQEVELELPVFGGRVELSSPEPIGTAVDRFLLVNGRGAAIPVSFISGVEYGESSLVIPFIPPGSWKLYAPGTPSGARRLVRTGGGPDWHWQFSLAAGETVQLVLGGDEEGQR